MQEKRGFVRLTVEAKAEYVLPGKSPRVVDLGDLGAGGMRVVCDEQISEGQVLKITLKIPGVLGDIQAEGRVVWQRKLGRDIFDTGIEFKNIEAEGEKKLTNYIQSVAGNLHEKREYVRCLISTPVKYRLLDVSGEEKVCESVDVSAAGLKVLTREKLERGTRLRIAFSHPSDGAEIVAKCTVVAWAKKSEAEDVFETGIEFLEISKEDREKISEYVRGKTMER